MSFKVSSRNGFALESNGSADEHDDSSNSRRKRERKQYHHHSAEQVQRLEAFFKECPHPDENQRRQLSREIGLEPRQIKFWFQNKRTQTKSHNERSDNNALRVENDRFYYETLAMREALRNLLERASRAVSTFSRRSGVLESYLSRENIPRTSMNTLLPQRFSEIQGMEKSVMVETTVNAMDELLELFRGNEPLWVKSPTNERYLIHRETHDKLYPKISHINSSSSWIESSRDSGLVPITTRHLIDIFQDPTWMFPSGCLIQDMPNGKANVAWVEHVQVDDISLTHPLYKDMVCDSQAGGAKRWIVTLQRMCERFAFSMGPRYTPGHELEGVIDAPEGRKSLTKLSHKMVKNFCHMLSMLEKLDLPQLSELNSNGFRVSVHRSDISGQPNNMIVCVAASLRLPTSFENLFDFFKDVHARVQWDVLSDGNPVHEIAHISTGTHPGNTISLMQPINRKENMLILQESSTDLLGANLIDAPVPVSAITSAMSGKDTTDTNVLPSGFIISSDGVDDSGTRAGASSSSNMTGSNSSLLTVAFQIMVRPDTFSDRLITDSVATIHALITSTVQKIRVAVGSRFG
ncbi:homeobox-leucine zipper protein HDG11-like [Coffea eugenioides]|uniref:homeobox-leucine zipper protein HDG11-like n=1 Tax=Coffea eugenioides TaxID=49369 RepID=UPI000F611A39|nr:homeobox-leucine zipper protein HDG11-like [Coffea eugenioides]